MMEAEGRLPDSAGRLHRRRLQCDRAVPSLPGRAGHPDLRRRGGRPRAGDRQARRVADRRAARRAARQPHLPPAGRRRTDPGGPLDLGRPGLSGHRPGALLAARQRPGAVRLGNRPGGARGLPALLPSDWRASSRRWSRPTRWPTSPGSRRSCRATTYPGDEHVRARRQGRLHRRQGPRGQDMSAPQASTIAK